MNRHGTAANFSGNFYCVNSVIGDGKFKKNGDAGAKNSGGIAKMAHVEGFCSGGTRHNIIE